jgi:hypothetical protein
MNLSTQTLSLLVLVSLGLGVTALAYSLLAAGVFKKHPEGPLAITDELQEVLDKQAHHAKRIERAVRRLAAESKRQDAVLKGAVQHVGMVRYDAFEDVGGRLSFSCALLDDRGDGVVITSINGRQDTRVYAKPISGGRSSHNLSEEEVAAIQQANAARPREAVNAG